ncbi:MAG: NAD-dependent epimerase/dehydratase family protein [Candidatus Magasanikbacteria bacterium]|nr:NAD-dependent epimerase/dehydratase family protein [Candidatus Magasanikbacteria bacterium]
MAEVPHVYLITGGAGFLGFHTARGVEKLGGKSVIYDVAPVDISTYPPGTIYIQGDVRDRAKLVDALKGIDVIVHAAAALPLEPAKEIRSVTIDGTRTVLEQVEKAGISRVVYISSTAVYGIPKKHPIFETDLMIGVGPYGESKIAAEVVCAEFRARGLCVPVIRPKTFIGIERLGVFQILFEWVRKGKKIPVIGSGKNRYQLLEVEDLVSAILLASTVTADKANDTFNVGAEEFGTVNEDVGALCAYAGHGARPMGIPAWFVKPILHVLEILKLSPLYKWVYGTADRDSFVSVDKIKEQLGWRATRSNAEALINAYKWYLQHYQAIESASSGTTHRVAWDQGSLKWFQRFF